MGGGLIQLVAYGAQDVYLTGNPQITFFKVVYRRHTNFARECIEQVFDGTASLGNSVVCTLSRSGDLVNNICLTSKFTAGTAAAHARLGHVLIKTCEVEIGGQRIDKHYSQWLQIWSELYGVYDGGILEAAEAGNIDEDSSPYAPKGYAQMIQDTAVGAGKITRLYVPLRFWFCNNPGLALPLIALQYHEVKIKLTFESSANIDTGGNTNASISDSRLLVDYIYLDTDERRRFAQVSHEYLIEQVQHEGKVTATAAGSSANVTVNYNHPVKYIAWAVENSSAPCTFRSLVPLSKDHHASSSEGSGKLLLNGNDRFEARSMDYFTKVQPYQHFDTVIPDNRIAVYSFANNPTEHQPSGTCNFSRIDSAIWQLSYGTYANGTNTTVDVASSDSLFMFAVNYNVLRIMSGMGGLAYSN
jgi:hypothetical protein